LDEKNPIFRNMPPIAGTLTWTKGLKERIKETYLKLSSFSKAITEREEFKDAEKLYNSLNKNITEYEDSKIMAWKADIESNAKARLKLNILTRDEDDLLKVNFDPVLIKMLKEVKYFYLLDRDVPETAATIYKSD
jgi:dynein heavy chain